MHLSEIISSIGIWHNLKNTLITMTDVYQRNEESLSQQDSVNPATIRICSVF